MRSLHRQKTFWIVAYLFAYLVACGPVRFSTQENSANPVDPGTGTTNNVLTRDVLFSTTVNPPNSKLDMLLIIDNSNSMLPDNQKLAAHLSGFVNALQGSTIDWQMCVTTTSTLNVNNTPQWGASILWADYVAPAGVSNWVLKAGTPNLTSIFTDTINSIGAGWVGTDDERGIKAAWWHLWNGDPRYSGNSGCYRNDAALTMIVISDEDERSVGGIAADQYYPNEYQPLENDDLPANLVSQVQDIFGTSKRFSFNSIIVKPDDTACMATQDAQGQKSHYGRKYAELSTTTAGGIGSICDNDFSANLNYFKGAIQTSIASFPLECQPYQGHITFKVNGTTTTAYQMTVQGMSAVFNPGLPTGATLELDYKCIVN
jgi:hypothetical protein